jgi:hypothetical protein
MGRPIVHCFDRKRRTVVLENQTTNEAKTRQREDFDRDFSRRVSRLVAGTDYRRADSVAQREEIGRLRAQAYRRDGAVSVGSRMTSTDPFDGSSNAHVFGLYIGGELASSLRLHVGSNSQLSFPSLEVFPEYLRSKLEVGKVVIDATHFVADERLSKCHRDLPYATLRLGVLAAEHFGADVSLVAVSAEQQPFYRCAFNYRMVCEARPYPETAKCLCLMALHFPSAADHLYRQYPFFHSSRAERQKLFVHQGLQTNLEPSGPTERKDRATPLSS